MDSELHWTWDDGDEHSAQPSIEDAVDDYLSSADDPQAEITLYALGPKTLPSTLATDILERALESLDEEYADPERPPTKATEAMTESAQELARVIEREYEVSILEIKYSRFVRVSDYS